MPDNNAPDFNSPDQQEKNHQKSKATSNLAQASSSHPHKKELSLALVVALVALFSLLGGGAIYLVWDRSNSDDDNTTTVQNTSSKPAPEQTSSDETQEETEETAEAESDHSAAFPNEEITQWYTVRYPDGFYVYGKEPSTFYVAEDRWQGEQGNVPTAWIKVYRNVISEDMSLQTWLEGIGDPASGVEISTKSCESFIESIRSEVEYGDLDSDSSLSNGLCLYHGVSEIKGTTVDDTQALCFETAGASVRSDHTILVDKDSEGVAWLFDIAYSRTGLSDDSDQTTEAYEAFLETFEIL